MRNAMRALAVSRPSIVATRRAKSEPMGAMAMAAVLDIDVPFPGERRVAAS